MEEVTRVVRFPIKAVSRLLRHSRRFPRCWPSMGHLFDGRYRKDGQDVPMDGRRWPRLDEVDDEKVVPYVMLMKDFGAYLMTASTVPLAWDGRVSLAGDAHAARRERIAPFKVFAAGMNPYMDSRADEAAVAVFGKDDIAEPLPLEWMEVGVKRSVAAGMSHLVLRVNEEEVALCLQVSSV